jgi:hypothetical protein
MRRAYEPDELQTLGSPFVSGRFNKPVPEISPGDHTVEQTELSIARSNANS